MKSSNDKRPNFNSAKYRQFYNRVTQPVKENRPIRSNKMNNYPIPRRNSDFDLFPSSTTSFQRQAQLDYEIDRRLMELRHKKAIGKPR
jgi:hypothetical protein